MKKSFRIFFRDLKRLLTNRIALIVTAGVCALPSLYAWFNIYANMDPYSNTQGIKVAIANCDEGDENELLTLNAGDSIIDNLKKNDALGWTFVDEDKAISGVKSGKYYAAIVIPEDFSSSLLSILSGDLQTPQLDYYINEKKNAIAPKITNTGATTIQQEINDTFSSVAAESISGLIQSSAGKITDHMDTLNAEVLDTLSQTRDNLAEYQTLLSNFQSTADSSTGLIQQTSNTLDQANKAAASSAGTLNNATALLEDSRYAIGAFSGQFSTALSNSETMVNNIYNLASSKLGNLADQANSASSSVGDSIDNVKNLADKNDEIIQTLQKLSQNLPDGALADKVNQQISNMQAQNAQLQALLASLKSGNDSIQNTISTAKNTQSSLETYIGQSRKSLQNYRNNFNTGLLPELNQSLDRVAILSGNLSATLSGVTPSVDQLKNLLEQLDQSLQDSTAALSDTGDALSRIDEQLGRISSDLRALQSSEAYKDFQSLEGIDEKQIASFMSSPVTMNTEAIYNVKNYGSSMTPFYTNLAIWVGGIILVNIIKLEVDKDKTVPRFRTIHAYFGRWLLYIFLGLIQAFIVCAGDIILLGVQCHHPVVFVLTGLLCAFVYVNLIYALSITFKHIGKALCVLLVILQIPGSSGTYPIEMMPMFFQRLHPLLPFTYGINAMRESIAGFYHMNLGVNLLKLCIFIPIAFFVGLCLRAFMLNLNHMFDKRLEETDLIICEENSPERRSPHIEMIIDALMGEKELREEILEHAAKFEAKFHKRIRTGFLLMLIIPLVFLVLAFSVTANVKLVFLILWILSLIALALYLICLEFIHSHMLKRMSLDGLSEEDLMKMMKEGKN